MVDAQGRFETVNDAYCTLSAGRTNRTSRAGHSCRTGHTCRALCSRTACSALHTSGTSRTGCTLRTRAARSTLRMDGQDCLNSAYSVEKLVFLPRGVFPPNEHVI